MLNTIWLIQIDVTESEYFKRFDKIERLVGRDHLPAFLAPNGLNQMLDCVFIGYVFRIGIKSYFFFFFGFEGASSTFDASNLDVNMLILFNIISMSSLRLISCSRSELNSWILSSLAMLVKYACMADIFFW